MLGFLLLLLYALYLLLADAYALVHYFLHSTPGPPPLLPGGRDSEWE